jgi:A/G-specific adenine glycosylase
MRLPAAKTAQRRHRAPADSTRALPEVGRPAWKRSLHRRLLAWFSANARSLPWRATRDPYAIWISETMLQQTQVATVVPYFLRFLAAFPNLRSLADADEQHVLRLWEGLGYYRRARQLHRAARIIVDQHEGRFPQDFEQVIRLPGVGRYTAGAVLSLAFDQRLPILEANTLRVYSRLLAYRHDPRAAAGRRVLWQAAEAWLPTRRVGTFNQAMMELGSRVCTPRDPLCPACPVARLCAARTLDVQHSIPAKAIRPKVTDVLEALLVIWRRGKVLLRRRGEDERWGGMWDFPRFPINQPQAMTQVEQWIAHYLGSRPLMSTHLTTLRHGVTRFRIRLECFEVALENNGDSRPPRPAGANGQGARHDLRWVRPAALADVALNVTARKVARLITSRPNAAPTPQARPARHRL